MTVRDNLPTGSSRNKIEYLADCIDQSGQSIPNLLVNPDFSYNPFDFNHDVSPWIMGSYSFHDQSPNHMNLGQSFGRPTLYGWGVEVNVDAGQTEGNTIFHMSTGSEVTRRDYKAKAAFRVQSLSHKARYLIFSVFTAPYHSSSLSHWSDETVEYSAYFRGLKYNGARFGVMELDAQGDFVRIVAESTIPPEPVNGYDFPQAWIHNITLRPGKLYAYFVETKKESSSTGCLINEAGVFLNPESLEVVPDMKPSIPETLRMTESLGTLNKSEVMAGAGIDVGRYPMPFGMEKHLILSACHYQYGDQRNTYPHVSITKQDYKGVLVKGGDFVKDVSHIQAFYSPFPVHLNYFNSPNYVAP